MYKLTTLKNGLKLITAPMPHVESVTVMIGIGAGSRYETKRVNGLFHFIEHMAFKGTKKRPSTIQIAQEVDQLGAQNNASTEKELTSYWLKLPATHTEFAFDLLSDLIINPLFDPKEIRKERGVIIEEINMYEDTPLYRAQDVFIELLYGDNPMGWDIAGDKKSIRQIKQKDFLDYQKKLYFPGNMALVVAGKFREAEIKKLTQKYFGDFQRKGRKITPKIVPNQKKPRFKLVTKKTEQAHFSLGVPGVAYSHPQRFVVGVLSSLLGGGRSSRIHHRVRIEGGLAYYVFCQPEFFTDSGYLMARAGVKLDQAEEAMKIVLEEFRRVATEKIPQEELKRAKEYLKGGLILALEDSYNVAQRYLNQALVEEKIRTPQEALKLIERVRAQDVLKAAQELLKSSKLNLAMIGPYQEEARFKKLLKL